MTFCSLNQCEKGFYTRRRKITPQKQILSFYSSLILIGEARSQKQKMAVFKKMVKSSPTIFIHL